MAALDDLVSLVDDETLRGRLRGEVARLRGSRRFGLVFEEHLPEVVAVPGRSLTPGCIAVRDDADPSRRVVVVRKVDDDVATVDLVGTHNSSRVNKTNSGSSAYAGGGNEFCVPVGELVAANDLDNTSLVPILEPIEECSGVDANLSGARHLLIEAENYHALRLLSFTHAQKIDCIYIDPPYNTGATDWVYNNRFVDNNDGYKHSKWLSMMQRRLRLARRLLRSDGVLIVAIDECEVHRLGLLLQQMFGDAVQQMVTVMILPQGNSRATFTRVDEYLLFCFFGDPATSEWGVCEWGDDHLTGQNADGNKPPRPETVRWSGLLRSGNNSRPQDRPGLCYPLLVCDVTHKTAITKNITDDVGEPIKMVVGTGRTLKQRSDAGEMDATNSAYDGYEPCFEGVIADIAAMIRNDGEIVWGEGFSLNNAGAVKWVEGVVREGSLQVLWPRDSRGRLSCWGLGPSTTLKRSAERRVKVNESSGRNKLSVTTLTDTQADQIETRELTVAADDPGWGPVQLNSVIKTKKPMTMWNRSRHVAGGPYGTKLLENLLGEKRFDFPKSLYSTLDAIGAVVADRPDAVVLDFFAGSGTTAHAVALLNLADNGRRQCITVTNNEVGRREDTEMRQQGLHHGEDEWEAKGVCRRVTWPRIQAAVTGRNVAGEPIPGRYLPVPFGPQLNPDYQPKVHEHEIAGGLPQNAVYTRLKFLDPSQMRWNSTACWTQGLATMWLMSGCQGPLPTPHIKTLTAHATNPGWLLPKQGSPLNEHCCFAVLIRPSKAISIAAELKKPAYTHITHIWIVSNCEEDYTDAREIVIAAKPGLIVKDWRSDMIAHFKAASTHSTIGNTP